MSIQFSEHPNVAEYDWRLWAATTVSETQQPMRLANGAIVNPGDVVVATCIAQHDHQRTLQFKLPSAAAFMLDMAHDLWPKCLGLLELFSDQMPDGSKVAPDDERLFRILEARMAHVVFSYTAIESFTNEMLFSLTHHGFRYSIPNRKTGQPYTLNELDHLSLATRLSAVMPEATGKRSPKKDNALWQSFSQLKRIRHFVIHSKVPDLIQPTPAADLLWKMLVDKQFRNFANVAKQMIMHFANEQTGRWVFKCPW